jgi:hypothetical protein
MDGLKEWRCKNGHVLGVVERIVVSSGAGKYHVSRLRLFRRAVDPKFDHHIDLDNVDVIAKVEGQVLDIRCSVCGAERTWWQGLEELKRILEARKAKV